MSKNQTITKLTSRATLAFSLTAIGSMTIASPSAQAITLKISATNLAPPLGAGLSVVWFGLHDGSYDLFNEGEIAPPGIETTAEDGITGVEVLLPEFLEAAANSAFDDFDFNAFIEGKPTLANTFTGSFQSLLYDSPLGLFPGETGTEIVTIDDDDIADHRFFAFASMLFPSNDAFIGNDDPIEIFDADGNFIPRDFILLGSDVWDAGTEVNDEITFVQDPINPSVPFGLDFLEFGTPENLPVIPFPGFSTDNVFNAVPFLFNQNADFTVEGTQVARITITAVSEPATVPEPATFLGLACFGGGLLLSGLKKGR